MHARSTAQALVVLATAVMCSQYAAESAAQSASSLNCSLSGYSAAPGLLATLERDALTLTWDADNNQQLRARFAITGGTPTIRELAVRRANGAWMVLAANVTPEIRVASGRRRMDHEAEEGLHENGITEITPEVFEKYQWDPFWDAPLNVPGGDATDRRTLGLPRSPDEVRRDTATFSTTGCAVATDGARLEVTFPGATVGLFSGELQFTFYKGSNLIKQDLIAKTEQDSVAYKYDAGLEGLSIGEGTRLVWRDQTNLPQNYWLGGARNDAETPIKTANRLVIAERGAAGSIAAFPPPHNFFWARESNANLGYNWYRKDSATTFSFGVRQAENEERANIKGNFALYSARPGTLQHMTVFYYAGADSAEMTRESVLAFTHGDRYEPVPGYKTMVHHFHMRLGGRLAAAGSPDAEIVDLAALRAIGIDIVSPVENVGVGAGSGNLAPADSLRIRRFQIEGARRKSDTGFLVMPNQEFYGSVLGGHTDLLFSHPVYWVYGRPDGQPLVDEIAPYGKVYHIGSPDDLMTMVETEDIMMSMPHPRTKNNTGYPDGFKDKAYFKSPRYAALGYRWGMGLDRSERRLCEYRCLTLLDDTSNWYADDPTPPKYLLAISEVQTEAPGDDIYSFAPVSYVKLDAVPSPDDASAVIDALMRGDSFVSTGEVLLPSYRVEGTGNKRRIVADVEWTFPLDFVEVVSGDGTTTGRRILSTTDMPAFGTQHFEIPFDAAGKKWVRFAAWDTAGNGVLAQPLKLAATAR